MNTPIKITDSIVINAKKKTTALKMPLYRYTFCFFTLSPPVCDLLADVNSKVESGFLSTFLL